MPVLLELHIRFDFCLHCSDEEADNWDCTVYVDFSTLPKLKNLILSHSSLGDLIFRGKPKSLETLEIFGSEREASDELSEILCEIGLGLEEIILNESWATCRALDVALPSVKGSICLNRPDGYLFCF